jgi:hypothetical protein
MEANMTIGATTGKEPDHIEDGDLKTVEELRGAMRDLQKAKLSLNERATVEGCLAAVGVMKQRAAMQGEQMNRLIGMYATLRREFDQFKRQRVIELKSWLATGGSTTPGDMDGSDT